MKTLTTTILTALASIGGLFGYYDNKLAGTEALIIDAQLELNAVQAELTSKEIELDNAVTAKQEVLKDFIYSQVRLHETPSIDLTFATPTEIQQAYIDLATDKAVELKPDDDAFIRLREKAVSEGTACSIK